MQAHEDVAPVAEVRADGVTTRYRSAGSGSPVLVLCDASDARFAALVQVLGAGRRVIAPLDSTDDGDARTPVERLASFLDGLGLGPMPVVGAGSAAGPAAALARLYPDRIDRLVLLGEPDADPAGHAETARAALESGD